MKITKRFFLLVLFLAPLLPSEDWIPDLGNGQYKNPVIYADYSDPDVIRVGDNFYMTSSSFNCFPALPILHSKDLVNWTIINHAVKSWPNDYFDVPQHGNGVWAPSFRYHDGYYWIFYGDPDQGIFMVKTKDVTAEWDPPILVKKAKGWIDPSPLWDDDGNAYLVHAFAKSRAGVNSILHVNRMSPDGTRLLDEGTLVFDGHENHPTIEGPKFYKINGYYYIFAPAGGVTPGWQTVLRSKNVFGPYEDKIVLAQGDTPINGPHQGGYIELENGEGWFVHFQDLDPYGRITHLQPVVWKDGWPVMGVDEDDDGTGEPVLRHEKPDVDANVLITIPQTTDEFAGDALGPQWQWHANPKKKWHDVEDGALKLYSQPMPEDAENLWLVPNMLLQKFPAPNFSATAQITFEPQSIGEKIALIIMGLDYAYVALTKTENGLSILQASCREAENGAPENVHESLPIKNEIVYLKVKVVAPGVCTFFCSQDGDTFTPIGKKFPAQPGKWIGAKVGLVAVAPAEEKAGHAAIDYIRIK